MTTSSARVLRGLRPPPHVFGPLGEDGPPAATFAPAASPVSVGRPARPPEPEPPDAAALDAARAEGHEAGRASRDAEVAALQAEVERLAEERDGAARAAEAQAAGTAEAADRLSALWAEAVRALEPDLAALAVDVAEAVLDAPLAGAQRAAVGRALADAVDGLAGALPVTVRVHPVALLALREAGLAGALEGAHDLRWEPDDALAPDEWAVETDAGAVHRLRGLILAALRDRLGLDAAPVHVPPAHP